MIIKFLKFYKNVNFKKNKNYINCLIIVEVSSGCWDNNCRGWFCVGSFGIWCIWFGIGGGVILVRVESVMI